MLIQRLLRSTRCWDQKLGAFVPALNVDVSVWVSTLLLPPQQIYFLVHVVSYGVVAFLLPFCLLLILTLIFLKIGVLGAQAFHLLAVLVIHRGFGPTLIILLPLVLLEFFHVKAVLELAVGVLQIVGKFSLYQKLLVLRQAGVDFIRTLVLFLKSTVFVH